MRTLLILLYKLYFCNRGAFLLTIITRTENCLKKFSNDFKKGLFSQDDGAVLKAWAYEMAQFGPEYITNSPNWRDHALDREWEGYRASSFSHSGRIIYRIIEDNKVEICEIERITPTHEYKEKD